MDEEPTLPRSSMERSGSIKSSESMEQSEAMDEASSRLAALAAEGRERHGAARAAEAEEARRLERRERREVERLGRSNVANAVLERPLGRGFPLLRVAMALVVAGTALVFLPGESGVWNTLGLALTALAIGGFFGGRWVLGRAGMREERAWLRSLPFPVRGWFRTLGATPAEETSVQLRIVFRGAAPDRALLEGLLGRVAYPATARLTGGRGGQWTAESGPIRSLAADDIDPTNGPMLGWMRCVVDEVLVPLHEVYPLRAVTFRG